MWDHYQSAIVKNIFIPYVVYLLCFVLLVSKMAGEYLTLINQHAYEGGDSTDSSINWS